MTGYLQLMDGRVVPVRDGIVIGRVAGCDCVIDDPKASRRHARVVVEAGVVEIEDLESSNGTMLNGKPVTRRLMRSGDEVQIGKTVIVYREGAPPGAAATLPGKGHAAAKTSSLLDDGDDLFADTEPAITKPVVPPPVVPSPAVSSPAVSSSAVPSPAVPPSVVSAPSVPRTAAPPPPPARTVPPPAAPPAPSVVEFADEIVEVRKAEPPAPKPGANAPTGPQVVATGSRVLQFQKHAGKGGLLGDDLGQMSIGMRSLLFAGVLLLGGAIVFGIVHFVR